MPQLMLTTDLYQDIVQSSGIFYLSDINQLSDICVELLSNTDLFSDIDLNLNINVIRSLLTEIYHLKSALSDIKLLPDIKPL